jgi:hypothetical protein
MVIHQTTSLGLETRKIWCVLSVERKGILHGTVVVPLQPIAMEAGHQVSISLVTIRQRVPTRLRVKEVLRVSLQRERIRQGFFR